MIDPSEDAVRRHCEQTNPDWPALTPDEQQRVVDADLAAVLELDGSARHLMPAGV